jgi:superfamily I DNA/RNA helicase
LNDFQLDELNAAYRSLYSSNARFQEHVIEILNIECDRDLNAESGKEAESWLVKKAASRDLELVQKVNELWARAEEPKLWPIDGIDLGPVAVFNAYGNIFYANGRISSTGMPVFLGNMSYMGLFSQDETISDSDGHHPIGRAINVKRNILSRHCGTDYIYLNSIKAVERLKWRIKLNSGPLPQEAPQFEVKLQGEMRYSTLPEAFWTQANFIESIDLEVPSAVGRISFREKTLEYHFAAALGIFWPHFEERLRNLNLQTFNRAFLLLAHSEVAKKRLTSANLRPLTHVMIDEFQDISPQIASWLRACQRRIAGTERNPTIMAIGDDWQSVYGWRGSAPDFFINFDDHFPIHTDVAPACRYEIAENHRSVAPIVLHAAELLKPVANKVPKKVEPQRPARRGDHGVRLQVTNITVNFDEHVKFIKEQYKEAMGAKSPEKNRVILLCRTNDLLDKFEEKLGQLPGLAYHTFHGAKGLQGEIAIVFEESEYGSEHVFRRKIYPLPKIFSQAYDKAMADEAYRLAYVALTRGMRRVFWFVAEPKHAAKALLASGVLDAVPKRSEHAER